MRVRLSILLLILLLCLGADDLQASPPSLEPCHVAGFSQEVLCGAHRVFENRATGEGRSLELHFVVIPAIEESAEPDPLVLLAGGPGQAAIDLVPMVELAFSQVRKTRDVVLIDQRGTGRSHPLECPELDEVAAMKLPIAERARLDRESLTDCLTGLDADVTLYTQDIANRDIHELTLALGYERIDLYGGSWGTRSALLYAHQFPEQVRAMVLDGNLPLANRAPSHAPADGERALELLLDDCTSDPDCHRAFPELEQELVEVLDGLGPRGRSVTLPSAISGDNETFLLTREDLGGALFGALYSAELSRAVPLLIHQANDGDFRPLSGLTSFLRTASLSSELDRGVSLTIFCSEELARLEGSDRSSKAGLLGTAFFDAVVNACSVWPKAPLPEIYRQEIEPRVPALLLSGQLDPITPPRWGEVMAESLPESLHLVAPATGHGVATVGCAPDLIHQFLDQGSVDGLDPSCLEELERPTFLIDASGPRATRQP